MELDITHKQRRNIALHARIHRYHNEKRELMHKIKYNGLGLKACIALDCEEKFDSEKLQ